MAKLSAGALRSAVCVLDYRINRLRKRLETDMCSIRLERTMAMFVASQLLQLSIQDKRKRRRKKKQCGTIDTKKAPQYQLQRSYPTSRPTDGRSRACLKVPR